LVRGSRLKLFIISGRRRADLRRRVGVRGVHCLGLYGSEREGNSLPPGATRSSIQESRRLIKERVRGLQGVWVEDKGLSFVVHYRGAPQGMAHRAQKAVCETLERLGSKTRTLESENSWEVLPREMGDKGIHTRRLLAGLSRLALPIYVGDDIADESAFAELRGGLTVRVGASPHTQACFFLCDPAEVTSFLKRLGEEIA
jgi:trehalose-phosphatase